MKLTIDISDIKTHGAEWASLLQLVGLHRMQTAESIAELLGCTVRHVDTELTAMSNKNLIDYVVNTKGKKMAFLI